MSDPQAAVAAATLAMTIVKNEANDSHPTGTWTVEQGAERFLEVMRNKGYALTPLAPEVPPRRDGLREALVNLRRLDRDDLCWCRENPYVSGVHDDECLNARIAATRTPEPPDSGDGAAWAKAFEEWKRNPPPLQVLPGDAGIDAALLAKAMEAARPAIEKADSVGLRYRAIHDDALCARDEHGCGCLCHTAAAIVREYAHLSAQGAE